MFTRCPACHTVFRVRPAVLRMAHGQVRCGRCDAQFNALDLLAESPDEWAAEARAAAGAAVSAGEPDSAAAAVAGAEASDAATVQPAPVGAARMVATAGSGPESVTAGAGGHVDADAMAAPRLDPADAGMPVLDPDALRELLLHDGSDTGGRWPRRAWAVAAALLLLTLAGQWVYLQRTQLYDYPVLRPALRTLCTALGCALPLERAPGRIDVLQRQVRNHPRVAGALLAEIVFVNRAGRPIAFPVLELRLSDVSGNRVAARRFAPAEYLSAGTDVGRGLQPGEPVAVNLELLAPRTDVVSFQFEFL